MAAAHEGSEFVRHCPCDSCGSSDANSLYSDGHTHCFACNARTRGDGSAPSSPRKQRMAADLIEQKPSEALLSRKIRQETCEKYGYFTVPGLQVANYYDKDYNLVAQKTRGKDKKFGARGKLSNDVLPFGAHVWRSGGRKLVVTEGEIDALSMSQVQDNAWPVVSVPNGAQGAKKHVVANLDYYSKFEEVVLMFDSDEPGREAARECAEVLGSRARIAELPLKDANEMLVAGRAKDLISAMWNAQPYRPEGIVDMRTLKERAKERPREGLSWWCPALTKLTYGIRIGEIYAFGAGTGVGKTDFFTQQMQHMVSNLKTSIGIFSLEQQVTETATRLAGKQAQLPLHIPDAWDEARFDSAWDAVTSGPGKVFLYDSFGANEWETIASKIEFLVHSDDVRYFFLDHLTALAAGGGDEEERVVLEKVMASMAALVKRLGITIFLISHLATPEKGSHEEGARVTIRQFKGSRAIGYWCHYMVGLERNQQAEDEDERTTTTVRVLKDRYTGRATGETFHLGYQRDTGMLFETTAPQKGGAKSHGFDDGGSPSDF